MTSSIKGSKLSAEDNERVFREKIVPAIFSGISKAKVPQQPTAVILGGQPGAGKTGVQTASMAELERRGATIAVVGDDLCAFHPKFSALQRTDLATSSQHTDHDAGVWFGKLLTESASRGINTVIETTMRQPENATFIMDRPQRVGYRVEARVLAVNDRVSWQGVNERFEGMLRAGQGGRIPPREVHDAAVSGMVETIRQIEERKLADRILVQKRDGSTVYENARNGGEWQQPPGAAQAVAEERQRPLTAEEARRHDSTWSKVISSMEARKADGRDIKAAKEQAQSDSAHFAAPRATQTPESKPEKPTHRGQKPR